MSNPKKERLLPQCPFFHDAVMKGANPVLICESPFPDSSMSFTFRFKHQWSTHQRMFCRQDYKNCPMYRYLMENIYKED